MILDGHIHIATRGGDREDFARRLRAAGVGGGMIVSLPPPAFRAIAETGSADERLDSLFWWAETDAELYPLFWIDPVEDDALGQVAAAVGRGVSGFKVICDRHDPGDARAMPVYDAIARAGRPILFHSGILWDGKPSSMHNRPAGFEPLLEVTGLRFCLAHISWPWCDEAIAVYGKFLTARRRRSVPPAEMFIDITPGTPRIYRREALTKLYTVGYDVKDNVIFGSDNHADSYGAEGVRQWIDFDGAILRDLGLPAQTLDALYCGNLRRFVGCVKNR